MVSSSNGPTEKRHVRTEVLVAGGGSAGSAADVRDVDVERLRETLRSDGMELDPAKHSPFAPVVGEGREEAK